jgi:hypothetical protein
MLNKIAKQALTFLGYLIFECYVTLKGDRAFIAKVYILSFYSFLCEHKSEFEHLDSFEVLVRGLSSSWSMPQVFEAVMTAIFWDHS